jgi:hypothetical protein
MSKIGIDTLHYFCQKHLEWIAFTLGILAMVLMNPYADDQTSWCLFELFNISFCPGEGLGHSIAFIFRGEMENALRSNMLGPFALIIIINRIIYLVRTNVFNKNNKWVKNYG